MGQREGIKAYIAASLVSLGNSYVISVDAFNCSTGDSIARVQVEAADKNHVLAAVSTAANTLRAKLGESLASVQKLTSPWMDVTTSSLEAFHAYSLGEDAHRKGSDPEALVFYKQAVDLDPNFAMAYARLGIVEEPWDGAKSKSNRWARHITCASMPLSGNGSISTAAYAYVEGRYSWNHRRLRESAGGISQ